MKKILFSVVLAALLINGYAQQIPGPRLIVRGDDMGSFQASNTASLESAKSGIETSIEIMVVAPWFPEAARMLRENPGIDAGIHLTITSEWDNMKWRPLTPCPSLTDDNGYFYPRLFPDKNYPGLSVTEHKWDLAEIEREFRAQIELGLKNIPHLTHISGHMGSTNFDKKVSELAGRLAREYDLADVGTNPKGEYGLTGVGYGGAHKTYEEKEAGFIKMLGGLESGKTYYFVDHPAYDTPEMQAVYHIGYEDVANDRQGVTDLFTSAKVRMAIEERGIKLISYNDATKALPVSTPEAEGINAKGITDYLAAVKKSKQDLHSLMIVRHGKVAAAYWFGDNAPEKKHVMHSVSKTFTSTAVGFAVTEGLIKVTDKVISFFPDDLPGNVSPFLAELEIRHLLTMSVGHEKDPTGDIRNQKEEAWEKKFLTVPIVYKPGTKFVYNSMATYMLSAIIQKVTGQKVIDYLYPRVFRPLGITGAEWDTSPSGVNNGGWGLYVKTEDMAKFGLFYLQKGKWNGEQLLPESWFDEATTTKIMQAPVWVAPGTKVKNSDWIQGYGYQIWRCRHNAYRADGANGQFIIMIPEKDTVVVTTANIGDMQAEINLIWKYILPALK